MRLIKAVFIVLGSYLAAIGEGFTPPPLEDWPIIGGFIADVREELRKEELRCKHIFPKRLYYNWPGNPEDGGGYEIVPGSACIKKCGETAP